MPKEKRKHPGRPSLNLGIKEKVERSRLTARECRFRKKIRYQYLEDLVKSKEHAVFKLQKEIQKFRKICQDLDSGTVTKCLQDTCKVPSKPSPEVLWTDKGYQARTVKDAHTKSSDMCHTHSISTNDFKSSEKKFDISLKNEKQMKPCDMCHLPTTSVNNSMSPDKTFDISFDNEGIIQSDIHHSPTFSTNDSLFSEKHLDVSVNTEDVCHSPINSANDSMSSETKFASSSENQPFQILRAELNKKRDINLEVKVETNDCPNLTQLPLKNVILGKVFESSNSSESQDSINFTKENIIDLFEALSQNLNSDQNFVMEDSEASVNINGDDNKVIEGKHIQDYVDFLIRLVNANSSTVFDETFNKKYLGMQSGSGDINTNCELQHDTIKIEEVKCKPNQHNDFQMEYSNDQNSNTLKNPDEHHLNENFQDRYPFLSFLLKNKDI